MTTNHTAAAHGQPVECLAEGYAARYRQLVQHEGGEHHQRLVSRGTVCHVLQFVDGIASDKRGKFPASEPCCGTEEIAAVGVFGPDQRLEPLDIRAGPTHPAG